MEPDPATHLLRLDDSNEQMDVDQSSNILHFDDTDEEMNTSSDGESVDIFIDGAKATPLTPGEVLTRCNIMLEELQIFTLRCEQKKHMVDSRQLVEYESFRRNILRDLGMIKKVR
jgi:hypothetical protein